MSTTQTSERAAVFLTVNRWDGWTNTEALSLMRQFLARLMSIGVAKGEKPRNIKHTTLTDVGKMEVERKEGNGVACGLGCRYVTDFKFEPETRWRSKAPLPSKSVWRGNKPHLSTVTKITSLWQFFHSLNMSETRQ